MLLVDTNIIIWVLRGESKYVEYISKLKNKMQLSLSVITVAEVYQNILPAEYADTKELLNEYIIWDVTRKIAERGGLYWQQYHKKFAKLYLPDCLIAATASEHELELLTLNVKHFPMEDIKVISI